MASAIRSRYVHAMAIHDPRFEIGAALYMIWATSPEGLRITIAAGTWTAIAAAWDAVQHEHPRDELALQHGARVIRLREPIGHWLSRPDQQ